PTREIEMIRLTGKWSIQGLLNCLAHVHTVLYVGCNMLFHLNQSGFSLLLPPLQLLFPLFFCLPVSFFFTGYARWFSHGMGLQGRSVVPEQKRMIAGIHHFFIRLYAVHSLLYKRGYLFFCLKKGFYCLILFFKRCLGTHVRPPLRQSYARIHWQHLHSN